MELEVITKEPISKKYKSPLLFVHGMWHAAWCWQPYYIPYFVDHGFVCHAISLRGHGNSENTKSLRFTSIDDYVDDLKRVVDSLSEPPVLVGHSMGGMVIQKYLDKYSVPGAVLLASVPPQGLLGTTLRFFGRHPLVFLKMTLTMSMYPAVATHTLCKEMLFSADMPEPVANAYFSRMQNESFRLYMELLALKLPKPKKLDFPLLVLGAENDMAFTEEEVHTTAEAYGVKAEIIKDISHDMMLDRNWLDCADRILNWMYEIGIEKEARSSNLIRSEKKSAAVPMKMFDLV